MGAEQPDILKKKDSTYFATLRYIATLKALGVGVGVGVSSAAANNKLLFRLLWVLNESYIKQNFSLTCHSI
jgi:hypothetical protein